MEKKIFTKKMALHLRKSGFKIKRTEVNYNFPQYDVYIFEDSPELREAMNQFNI